MTSAQPMEHSQQPPDLAAGRRSKKRRRAGRGVPIAIQLAPMIDVTFLLLIFFLVTTTFERAEGILSAGLPRQARADVPLPISPIVVRVAQTGPEPDDFTVGVEHFPGAPRDMEQLVLFLLGVRQQPGFDAQTPVVIVAGNDVRWDHVVAVWNSTLRAGYERIAFAEP